jgi:hypothetical protein
VRRVAAFAARPAAVGNGSLLRSGSPQFEHTHHCGGANGGDDASAFFTGAATSAATTSVVAVAIRCTDSTSSLHDHHGALDGGDCSFEGDANGGHASCSHDNVAKFLLRQRRVRIELDL